MTLLKSLFYIDHLSIIMMLLVGFVAACVASFSSRYLQGDRKKPAFYGYLVMLILSVFTMVCADNIILLYISWAMSNGVLTRLMIHKREWRAALHSSRMALGNFAIGLICAGFAFALLYYDTQQTSIRAIIIEASHESSVSLISAVLLLLAAMTQSALFPFHRWLLSSLNSPTPVSAIMHAGLVNGGGFLFARFAPILAEYTMILHVMFIMGLVTALLGTLWKLMQSDVKRMLACSTMGQMGFMVVQCGLGLFPAAIAHLCWHGLFKAYLFFASGSAAQEKRLDLHYPPSFMHSVSALICGLCGAAAFAYVSGKSLIATDTTLFLTLIAFVTSAQFALPLVRNAHHVALPLALLGTTLAGAAYGCSVHMIEQLLEPMHISYVQPLNILHIIGFLVLAFAWSMLTFRRRDGNMPYPQWMMKHYVKMLNASQPHPLTVTAHRNHYQY